MSWGSAFRRPLISILTFDEEGNTAEVHLDGGRSDFKY